MIRRIVAILLGKAILFLTKLSNQGGGTAAPGLYALKIYPALTNYFVAQRNTGAVVITGTNGKTTTSRIISHYFSQNNISYIHNRAGSNLERGIVSTCIEKCSWTGTLNVDFGVWEIDEATFTQLVGKIKPEYIILLNLFRDQLDRYGEVDATKRKWMQALSKLTTRTKIIFNNDDPQLVHLANLVQQSNSLCEWIPFSVASHNQIAESFDYLSPVEMVLCPQCKTRLSIKQTLAGLGQFSCSNCNLTNKDSAILITDYIAEKSSTTGHLVYQNSSYTFSLPVPGLYNTYNFLASFSFIGEASMGIPDFLTATSSYTSAFARTETVKYGSSTYILNLIKNPTGLTESLKATFLSNTQFSEVVFILNDNFADGKDVSWIWDVNIPKYVPKDLTKIIISGTRRYDMALRLKYAGMNERTFEIRENLHEIFESSTHTEFSIPVFATYTASLTLQEFLGKTGVKNKYWKD